MSKTFSLRSMLVPSKGRSETLRNGGVVIGGVTSIGTSQENASTVIDKINNTTVVLRGDYSKIQRISITDLLNLTQDEIGANDLYIVYASGSDESGWSEESFIYEEETCPAASFFQWINGKWEHITDEIDLSKALKYDSLPKETYMIMSLNGQTSFPNIYGRNRAGLPIAVLGKYQLDEKGVYKPMFETTGTPGGGTSSNYTWTITVPYARFYIQGGEPIYEGGLLSASDYKRLIENTGVGIDTVVPETPSDLRVPSTKLFLDAFESINSLLGSKADKNEFSNYYTKTYIDENYEPKKNVWNAYTEASGAGSYITFLQIKGVSANLIANREYQFTIRLLGRHSSFGGDCTIRIKGTVASATSIGAVSLWCTSGEASIPGIRLYKISDTVYELAALKTNKYAYAVAKIEDSYASYNCVELEKITDGTSYSTAENYYTSIRLPQADWNETDSNKAGYIKNKPQIDTVVPETPSDLNIPSTKLFLDAFESIISLLGSKADKNEFSNYYTKTYIDENYYNKSLLDQVFSKVQYKSSLAEDVEALGFTKNVGTITGINFNGTNAGRSGIVSISALPLGEYTSSYNNGVTQTGKWCEIAYCYIQPDNVVSKSQIFSVTRPTGLYDKMQGFVSVSIRVSYGTVTHLYLNTDNIYLKKHFKVVYDKSKDRCSIYVTANEAWETWRLTAISYPVFFTQGLAQNVDEPTDPTNGMLVDATCYNTETYNKIDIGPIYNEDETNKEKAVNVNAIALWNGAYNYQNSSNLAYCRHGEFGTIVTKNVDDYETKKAVWNAYTEASGAGSYITFLQIKGVSANLIANREYQFTIRLLGRHSSFGGDCTIRIKGTVASATSIGTVSLWCTSGEVSIPGIRLYKISDTVYELAALKTNKYAYAVAKIEDSYASGNCVKLEKITNGSLHATTESYYTNITVAQADWNVTDSSKAGFIKNKPAAVTEETVSGWGFVKRKFVRRTITYSNGAYGGAILDSRGVDKCTAYNGRSLSVTITGLTTQQEYQDFLLQNTISVSYTYFEDGVATRSDGIISKISAGTAINIQLKQDMLHLTDALVYVSVVFDKII